MPETLQNQRPPRSLTREAFLRLMENRMAVASAVFLTVMVMACLLGPWLSPHALSGQNLSLGPTGPSAAHWMGTDLLGRDLLTRLLHGGRISIAVGLLATLVAVTIGALYGGVSGYCGGRTDRIMMRLLEIIYSLPFTIFVILLMVLFGRHLWLIFVAIGAVTWPPMARIIRGEVMGLRRKPFIEAAEALGQSHRKILMRHMLPNVLGLMIVYATLTVPQVMLLEAFLSFLGLGVQAPLTSWGDLIKQGAASMEEFPWLLIYPSLLFSATLFALNFLGDGLRDAFDPRAGKGAGKSSPA